MKVLNSSYRDSMADITKQPRGMTASAQSDKSRKVYGAGMKKRCRTFGVPLEDLVRQAPQGYKVPFIVKKICTYIEHHGLHHEGIFRISGSQRDVEKLRASCDLHGDANLDEDNDMMAVAGLLKLFLRELPQSVIPEHMTRQFVNIQEATQRHSAECVSQLQQLLRELPEVHYDLLKHMVRFLAIVACNEPVNKMSPMALAIVFGPNLFRCGKGFLALKDQGTTNQIVYRFIVDYNTLFKDPTEDPPAVYWERKRNNVVPDRPPPPKFHVDEIPLDAPSHPVPLPRKSKMKNDEGPVRTDTLEDQEHSESSLSSRGRNSHSYNSPSFSDDEMTGRLSPFHLDSDSGFSLVESPVPSARTSEFVDKAIKATVIGHLFGDESSLLNASIDTTIREDHTDPAAEGQDSGPALMQDLNSTNEEEEDGTPVHERVKLFEMSDEPQIAAGNKPTKSRPTSKAFEMFEQKGIIITQMLSGQKPAIQDTGQGDTGQGKGFEGISEDSDTLQNFKRPSGPQNRRSPSRRRQPNGDDGEEKMDEQENQGVPNGHLPIGQDVPVIDISQKHREDINHNDSKSRIAFLDIRTYDSSGNARPGSDKSPTGVPKPFVPLLDFTTLHENVGGQDPILALKSQTYDQSPAVESEGDEDRHNVSSELDQEASPANRVNKVKRKAGTAMEEDDFPPFSQVEQDQYKQHSHGGTDDELTIKMKSQMRKIQGLKKKVRNFEDAFEKEHGYKPSHAEKAAKPEIKKFMMELSKARKEAKRLKEEAEMGSRSRHGSGASNNGGRSDPPDLPPTMGQTLDVILKRLKEKRKESVRPEDIELMTSDQVQDEKLAVQKALLHFEGIHGRPKLKEEKDLMRPLYDRYRTIKRMLSRQPMSPRSNLELPTVPEDRPIEIKGLSKFSDQVTVEPIRVPTANMEELNDVEEDHFFSGNTMEFAVTRDFPIFKPRPTDVDSQGPHSPKARKKLTMQENIENRRSPEDCNLHELTAPELHDQLLKAKDNKKRLRKVLRDFEEMFTRKTGRKVGRDDRMPMQAEYTEYKELKARLKLLEALLSKHNHPDC